MPTDDRLHAAFADQAGFCDRLGSPFTALVCRTIGDRLDQKNGLNAILRGWNGDPSPVAGNLPLRIAAGLHALARGTSVRSLSGVYPPASLPSPPVLYGAMLDAAASRADFIARFIASAPQTNEVSRSAVLLPGMLEIASRTRRPLGLFEIGSSAGLNLVLDRYRYTLGSAELGDANAAIHLAPEWTGGAPPAFAALRIIARRGCDLNPIDVRDAADCERLLAYVWADQGARLHRLEQAIAAAALEPPPLDRTAAGDWLEATIADPVAGIARVLFHSLVWSYLPQEERARITQHMQMSGDGATAETPLAWLRFEPAADRQRIELRLTLWPGGDDQLLATADPHGNRVNWLHPGEPN